MKIKPLSRNEEDFTRERKSDKQKVFKSQDPQIHPFERAREYTRALNAVKWERLFATPFVASLDGHTDGVYAMSTVPNSLVLLLSGAGDGEVRLWNLSTRQCVWRVKAHDGLVRGLTVDTYGERVFSCSSDKTIKCWKLHRETLGEAERHLQPVATYLGAGAFGAVDHQRKSTLFASASTVVDIWDRARAEPLHSFQWGADSIHAVRFNPVDTHVLASSAADRSVVLYDVRQKTPIRKLIMQMSSNAIAWNPMEAFNFTVANEDTNLYTFDMRKLDIASNVHRDHVSAVMSVDYAPTGREFVSGAYDRTVRIWKAGADASEGGHSREVYHTKRMQRIFSVRFSADNRYVLSGSDDTNIRLWKAVASDRLRTLLPREQNKRDYLQALKERFRHQKETSRIARHRHLPKQIYNQKKRLRDIVNAKREKLRRVIKHSKPGAVPLVPERKKKIVKQIA